MNGPKHCSVCAVTYFSLSFVKMLCQMSLMSGDAELTADVQRYISSHIR
jgi:hypothetical protein